MIQSRAFVQNPGVAVDQHPASGRERARRIHHVATRCDAAASRAPTSTPEALAKLTAGLKRMQLQSLISRTPPRTPAADVKFLTAAEEGTDRSRIRRAAGIRRRAESTFRIVAGHRAGQEKAAGRRVALRAGRADVLPMGYVICGPVGTGKTFLTTCFAGEVGIPAVMPQEFPQHVAGPDRRQPRTGAALCSRP